MIDKNNHQDDDGHDDHSEYGHLVDISRLDRKKLKSQRRELQLIFQDPYASLNPRLTVGSIVGEAFKIHNVGNGREVEDHTVALLKKVGLHADHMRRYRHEFSGGQRHRIGIARALALNPKIIVADEPVSALDVSIQAQVINLLPGRFTGTAALPLISYGPIHVSTYPSLSGEI